MEIFAVILLRGRSARPRKINAGPSVISVYRREGGYLVTFKNERMSKAILFCIDQGAGSPNKLMARSRIKTKIAVPPPKRKIRILVPLTKKRTKKRTNQHP